MAVEIVAPNLTLKNKVEQTASPGHFLNQRAQFNRLTQNFQRDAGLQEKMRSEH